MVRNWWEWSENYQNDQNGSEWSLQTFRKWTEIIRVIPLFPAMTSQDLDVGLGWNPALKFFPLLPENQLVQDSIMKKCWGMCADWHLQFCASLRQCMFQMNISSVCSQLIYHERLKPFCSDMERLESKAYRSVWFWSPLFAKFELWSSTAPW